MDGDSRRDLARRAVATVAERHGVAVDDLAILKDSNNTVVGVNRRAVAKVATSTLPGRDTALGRELAILQHLDGRPAPVVRLSNLVPDALHEALGCTMLWLKRLDEVPTEIESADALAALSATHAELAKLQQIELPSFLQSLTAATAIFGDDRLCATLPRDERRFCRGVGDQLAERFAICDWVDIVLHGDPWPGGNMIMSPDGVRLLDFEAVCIGPREWDLSSLGDIADHAAEVDGELLGWCRLLRSYTVAAWCWSQPGRAPEVDGAARWQLQLLHRQLD